MSDVIGAGQIGQAISRRVSAGKHVLLADLHKGNVEAAAGVLADAGFDVSTATVDVSSRESAHALAEAAAALGDVTGVIHAAGVSPSQAREGPPMRWALLARSSWALAGRSSREVTSSWTVA